MAIYLIVAGTTPSASGLQVTGSGLTIDFATVARQGYVTSIGDGSTKVFTITHNLATRDVHVEVYKNSSPYDTVVVDTVRNGVNTVQLTFASAPTTNDYRVVVMPMRGN